MGTSTFGLRNCLTLRALYAQSLQSDVLRQRKSGQENLADLSKCVSSRIALDPRRSSSYDGAGRARDPD